MIYSELQGKKLSLLGFGAMRLPVDENKTIDEAQVEAMVDYAMEHGVNYFDTAYPYHGGLSEMVMGRVLKKYPRDSFYLATKFPGHQVRESYDPSEVFEKQLKKCGVDYFDFYLLHNVYEKSIGVYTDPHWNIVEYFLEQKRKGRIRHLGFSTHGSLQTMEAFLNIYGDQMEFCQIQMNYLDWSLQDAKAKYEMLTERGIPVWVMEPVRGGRLASLSAEQEKLLKQKRPDLSDAAWCFRFLQSFDNVKMVLSGMSNMAQMQDNVATFEKVDALNEEEFAALYSIAEEMKNSVPCTACRYCCDGCPMQLDIPGHIAILNELRILPSVNASMRMEALPEDKRSTACIGCGHCSQSCPQGIDVVDAMRELNERLTLLPSWAEVCRQRDEEQRKNEA